MLSLRQFEVNIPVPVVARDYKFPEAEPRADFYQWFRVGAEILSPECIDWLESRYILPTRYFSGLLFHAPSGARTAVHVDKGTVQMWALNVVLTENADLRMRWHDTQGAGVPKTEDLQYFSFPDESPIVEEVKVTSHVAKIGIPHSSINYGEATWLLSMRMEPYNLSWPFLYHRFCGEV